MPGVTICAISLKDLADMSAVNLAALVADREQIYIPAYG